MGNFCLYAILGPVFFAEKFPVTLKKTHSVDVVFLIV